MGGDISIVNEFLGSKYLTMSRFLKSEVVEAAPVLVETF